MRTINASEFEARCLQLLEEVAESGEPLVITKGGEPVYVLSPYPGRS
ncbi:MAG TPA: type II toxin-antitoxin system Phd/YefM family antitoxin, partial [Thermoanaerobaculia bacterium]|nr:type II toxin-antitoxin system Phd/YefM family antitoxin [Thermoanaerobaculia bacterium]